MSAREFLKCVLVPKGAYALQNCIGFIQTHFNYFWNCIYHTTASMPVSCSFINCQAVSTLSYTFRFFFLETDHSISHFSTCAYDPQKWDSWSSQCKDSAWCQERSPASDLRNHAVLHPLVREAVTLYSRFLSYCVHMSTRIKPRSWVPYWSTRVPDWIKRQADWGMRGQHMPEASACSHVNNSKWRSSVCG